MIVSLIKVWFWFTCDRCHVQLSWTYQPQFKEHWHVSIPSHSFWPFSWLARWIVEKHDYDRFKDTCNVLINMIWSLCDLNLCICKCIAYQKRCISITTFVYWLGLFPKCCTNHIPHQQPIDSHGRPREEFGGHFGGHLTNSLGFFSQIWGMEGSRNQLGYFR